MCKCCVKIHLKNAPANLPEYCYDSLGQVAINVGVLSLEKTKKLEELSDLNTITSDGVLGFELLNDACNRAILKAFACPSALDSDNNLCLEVCAMEGSITLRQNLLRVLQKTNNGWEVELVDGSDFWKTALADCRLCDLDFPSIVFDEQSVVETWNNPQYNTGDDGYYFPLVHYGNWFQPATYMDASVDDNTQVLDEPTVVSVEDFRPWFHALAIMKKAFCKVGWEFHSPIFETDWGRRLIVSFFTNFSDIEKEGFGFKASTTDEQIYITDSVIVTAIAPLPVLLLPFSNESTGSNYDTGQSANGIGFFDPSANNHYGTNLSGTYNITVDTSFTLPFPSDMFIIIVVSDNMNGPFFASDLNDDVYFTQLFQAPAGTSSYTGTATIDIQPDEFVRAYIYFRDIQFPGPTGVVHSASFQAEIQEFVLAAGAILPLGCFLDCDKKFIPFFEGMLHLIGKGKLTTDFINKRVTAYHPESTEISDQSTPESFYNISNTVKGEVPLVCNVCNAGSLAAENNRYYQLGFSKAQDCYVTDVLKNEDLHSKKIDFGAQKNYVEETTENRNNCFEPTGQIIADDLASTDSGTPEPGPNLSTHVEIPAVWDNCDNEVTQDAGPRIAYAAGLVSQYRGDDDNGNPIFANWVFDPSGDGTALTNMQELPFIFQLTDQIISNGNTASKPSENVVYGDTSKDMYSLFWCQYLEELRKGSRIEHQALLSNCQLEALNFRDLWDVVYEGKHYRAKLLEASGFSTCPKGPGSLIFSPLVEKVEDCKDADGIIIDIPPCCEATESTLTCFIDANGCLDATVEHTNGGCGVERVAFRYRPVGGTYQFFTEPVCDLPPGVYTVRATVIFTDDLCPRDILIEQCTIEACGDNIVLSNGDTSIITINEGDDCRLTLRYSLEVDLGCCEFDTLTIQAKKRFLVNGIEVNDTVQLHTLMEGSNTFGYTGDPFLQICQYDVGDILRHEIIFQNLVVDSDCEVDNQLGTHFTELEVTQELKDDCGCPQPCPAVVFEEASADIIFSINDDCDFDLVAGVEVSIPDCCESPVTIDVRHVFKADQVVIHNWPSTMLLSDGINYSNIVNLFFLSVCEYDVGTNLQLTTIFSNVQSDCDVDFGELWSDVAQTNIVITQELKDLCECVEPCDETAFCPLTAIMGDDGFFEFTFCTAQQALDYYNAIAANNFFIGVQPGGFAILLQTPNPLVLNFAIANVPVGGFTGSIFSSGIETCEFVNGEAAPTPPCCEDTTLGALQISQNPNFPNCFQLFAPIINGCGVTNQVYQWSENGIDNWIDTNALGEFCYTGSTPKTLAVISRVSFDECDEIRVTDTVFIP